MEDVALSAEGTATARGAARRREDLLRAGEWTLHVEGSLARARGEFDRAYRAAEQASDAAGMVRAAIGLGGLWVHEHRAVPHAALVRRRVHQSLRMAEPGSAEHLLLRLRIAAEDDYAQSRHDRVTALLPRARGFGDPHVLTTALSLAHHCVLGAEYAGVRAELAEEMVEAASLSRFPGDLAMALMWRTVDRFLAGDHHAERSLENVADWLSEHPHAASSFVVDAQRVMLAIRAGRLAEAEELAVQCAAVGQQVGDLDFAGWLDAHLVAIRWFQGRIGELLEHLTARVHSPSLTVLDNSTFGALAAAAASVGDRAGAALALARLGGDDLSGVPRSSTWLVSLFGAAAAAHFLGEAAAARSAYDLLLPFADRPMMVSLGVSCFGSTEHALGLAALAMDRRTLAAEHLRAAVKANLALGHWPAAVHSRYWLGRTLSDEPDEAARREGARQLAQARAAAADQGWSLPSPDPAPVSVAAPVSVPMSAAGPESAALLRHGAWWTLHWDGRSVEVRHSIGVLYLSVLLAQPGQEIPAAELAAGWVGDQVVHADRTTSGHQETLDEAARASYRRRLSELTEHIERERSSGDRGKLPELTAERDWIAAELGAASGPAGRSRTFTSNAERARISVGKALRRAVDRIGEADPQTGDALRRCLQTGVNCCYRPGTSVRLGRAGAQ